ncbi:MAG: hypothetical protein KAR20_23010, partial [Candidatus Heimdallarchaeota archaeon]|nr:hypothetical protein [Candidatus Heimdallarchaeota archaeon]
IRPVTSAMGHKQTLRDHCVINGRMSVVCDKAEVRIHLPYLFNYFQVNPKFLFVYNILCEN